jgi:hypothetical protein
VQTLLLHKPLHAPEAFMRLYLHYLGNVLALAAMVFLGVEIVNHLHEIPEFQWRIQSFLTLSSALLFFVVVMYYASYVWVVLLRGCGIALPLKDAYTIIGKSLIGKYLPGNIFHFVGRVALGTHQGISTEAILLTMGIEAVVIALTAATIAFIGLIIGDIQVPWLSQLLAQKDRLLLKLPITAGIAIVLLLLLSSNRLRAWVKPRLVYLHPGRIAVAIAIYVLILMLHGVVIVILLNGLWSVQTAIPWYRFSFGFSLAWLLGFIVPGAPSGIGIREAVFVGLFGKEIGEGLVVGLAIVLRIITSISDILTFGIAYWLGQK